VVRKGKEIWHKQKLDMIACKSLEWLWYIHEADVLAVRIWYFGLRSI
jgi:hypothetical protein